MSYVYGCFKPFETTYFRESEYGGSNFSQAKEIVDDRIFNALPGNERDQMSSTQRCAEKYAACNHPLVTGCGLVFNLGYLIYRMQQAVKAIFGCSDWQIARTDIVHLLKSKPDGNNIVAQGRMTSNGRYEFVANQLLKEFVGQYDRRFNGKDSEGTETILLRINNEFRLKYGISMHPADKE